MHGECGQRTTTHGQIIAGVSQPFTVLPSQFEKPAAQRMPHTPVVHEGTAFGAPEHTVPHVPQFVALTCVLISQPFAANPSQFAKFVTHAIEHAPPVQRGVALVAPAQMFPHELQFVGSLEVLTSQPSAELELQSVNPELHTSAHPPPTQAGAAFGDDKQM